MFIETAIFDLSVIFGTVKAPRLSLGQIWLNETSNFNKKLRFCKSAAESSADTISVASEKSASIKYCSGKIYSYRFTTIFFCIFIESYLCDPKEVLRSARMDKLLKYFV